MDPLLWTLARTARRTQGKTGISLLLNKGYEQGYTLVARWRDTQGEIQRGPQDRSFCPQEVGVCHPPGTCRCLHQPRSSLPPVPFRFLWRLHRLGAVNHHLNFQPLPLLWRMGPEAEDSKLLIMACSFWWLASLWEPHKGHIMRTKDTPITQEILRDWTTLCQRPQGWKKRWPSTHYFVNYKGFRSSVPGTADGFYRYRKR